MRPDPRELVAERARLRDLVLVVREDEVEPAAVDLEDRPEQLLGHHGALDVPARPAASPRRVPGRVLARLVRLPEREVARILLERVRLLLLDLVGPLARELAVVGEARDAEVDVALDRVGEARARRAPRSRATICGTISVAFGSSSGMPRPRSPVSSRYQAVARSASAALSPGAAS